MLPTYNRSNVLDKSLSAITCSVSENVCILVIDNDSSDDTLEIVQKYQRVDDRIKYIKNRINVGPSRTLYLGFLNVDTEFFIIRGDRDEPTPYFFEEVIKTFELNSTVGVFHAAYLCDKHKYPKEMSKMIARSGIIKSGFNAMEFMFNASGMIHGLAFRTSCVKNEYWILDANLYPQTLIAGMVGLYFDAYYYISESHYLFVPPGTGSLVAIKNDQKRPNDWGILERLEIAKRLINENNKKDTGKNIQDIIPPLMQFAALTFRKMCQEEFNMADKFLKSILADECVVESEIFWNSVLNYLSCEKDQQLTYKMVDILQSNTKEIREFIQK